MHLGDVAQPIKAPASRDDLRVAEIFRRFGAAQHPDRLLPAPDLGAAARGVAMAQVALAWVLRNPGGSAPIIGATKPQQLTEAVAALDVRLTQDEVAALQKPYTQHGPSWF